MVLRLFLACFALEKEKDLVGSGCEGDGVRGLVMGCVVDVDGGDFLCALNFDYALLVHPFVSFQIATLRFPFGH